MRLPPRVRALKAAPDTAGPRFLLKGFALHPLFSGERGNSPINPNLPFPDLLTKRLQIPL